MKTPCKFCGGSGQISFFKGVSRFLLSEEECPECAGLGYEIITKEAPSADKNSLPRKKSGRKKK